jgi:hypothetical protein
MLVGVGAVLNWVVTSIQMLKGPGGCRLADAPGALLLAAGD